MGNFRILLYHSVGRIDPGDDLGIRVEKDAFRSQMEFLKGNYNVLSLKDAVDYINSDKPVPQKSIVITFDDGYKDNLLLAAPIIEEFGFRAMFFVTVSLIGKVKSSPKRRWQYWECMDKDDLRHLLDKGHDIGSHSCDHIDLLKLTKEEKKHQLMLSKKELGSLFSSDIEFFSYPYGYFDNELPEIVRDEGYKAACTAISGANTRDADLYRLKRTEITGKDTEDIFRLKLKGHYD